MVTTKEIDASGDSLEMMVNMGPQHPSTHGVFRLLLHIDGERVVEAEPHIGYLHRGSEKLCEGEDYAQIITLFDRLDYISNLNCELAFCLTVEKLMALDIPDRAEYIRVILCELNRIANHMLFYGAIGLDAGAMTPILYGFRERERVQSLFESVTGARMMHNYIRVGGVRDELPEDFVSRMATLVPQIEQGIEECDRLLSDNEMFLARTKGIGTISAEDAIDFGVTGPSLRASGVPEDVRVSEPYGGYDHFEFGIPVGSEGDCWDRYYVRMEEMRQSLVIIRQAMDRMEPGPIMAKVRRITRPPKGEVYLRSESPRGDFGVYLVSDGSDKPYRVKVRAPSFANLQALRHLLRDAYVADVVIVLGSIDIVLGEVDR